MKKLLLLLLISSSIFAQNSGKIAEKITQYQKENKHFADFSIFAVNNNYQNTDYKKTTDNATIATLDLEKVNQIVAQKNDFLEIQFPYQGENISVLLYKVDIKTEEFQLDTDKQKNVAVEKGVHYRGIIKNDLKSLVSFNFFNNQMSAIVSGDKYSNVVIGKLKTPNNTSNYIIYSDATMKVANSFVCSTKDVDPKTLENTSQDKTTLLTNRCATIYFEMDYDLYQSNNSSISECNVWMSSVFNNVQTLYANDNINVAFNSLFVWTSQDPYDGTSSFENLNLFHQTRPVFNGDLGQLVGIDGGFGGVATAINGLCSENNFSYSDVYHDFNTVPTFSWTVQVITHELGHLLGSPHTHGCYWNGNNTSIDGCGPTANVQYTEGSCATGPIPSGQTKGTIMSYCHLIQGVGISFNNGFGPQPAARIFQSVNAATCLGSDCITTCINKVASISTSNVTNTTAKVSWTDQDAATSWQVAVVSSPFTANPTWTTVTDNPHTFTNLTPNTYYKFKIRKNCGASIEGTSRDFIFATSDDFCAGRSFTDAEGNNNYDDNENWVRVVAPLNSNNKIKVVFTSLDLEDTFDFLYIHDGTDTSSPEMTNGGLTGNNVPSDPFQATNSAGALTFHFVSDPAVEGEGWTGNFSCVSLGINNQDYIDYSYYPNPVKNDITITSKDTIQNITIYSIDGRILYDKATDTFETKINLSDYAKGTYIFKLQIENKTVTFKISR